MLERHTQRVSRALLVQALGTVILVWPHSTEGLTWPSACWEGGSCMVGTQLTHPFFCVLVALAPSCPPLYPSQLLGPATLCSLPPEWRAPPTWPWPLPATRLRLEEESQWGIAAPSPMPARAPHPAADPGVLCLPLHPLTRYHSAIPCNKIVFGFSLV